MGANGSSAAGGGRASREGSASASRTSREGSNSVQIYFNGFVEEVNLENASSPEMLTERGSYDTNPSPPVKADPGLKFAYQSGPQFSAESLHAWEATRLHRSSVTSSGDPSPEKMTTTTTTTRHAPQPVRVVEDDTDFMGSGVFTRERARGVSGESGASVDSVIENHRLRAAELYALEEELQRVDRKKEEKKNRKKKKKKKKQQRQEEKGKNKKHEVLVRTRKRRGGGQEQKEHTGQQHKQEPEPVLGPGRRRAESLYLQGLLSRWRLECLQPDSSVDDLMAVLNMKDVPEDVRKQRTPRHSASGDTEDDDEDDDDDDGDGDDAKQQQEIKVVSIEDEEPPPSPPSWSPSAEASQARSSLQMLLAKSNHLTVPEFKKQTPKRPSSSDWASSNDDEEEEEEEDEDRSDAFARPMLASAAKMRSAPSLMTKASLSKVSEHKLKKKLRKRKEESKRAFMARRRSSLAVVQQERRKEQQRKLFETLTRERRRSSVPAVVPVQEESKKKRRPKKKKKTKTKKAAVRTKTTTNDKKQTQEEREIQQRRAAARRASLATGQDDMKRQETQRKVHERRRSSIASLPDAKQLEAQEDAPAAPRSHELKVLHMERDLRCMCLVKSKLWIASRDGTVHIRHAGTGDLVRRVHAQVVGSTRGKPFHVNAMVRLGKTVWTGDSSGVVRGFSLKGKLQFENHDHKGGIRAIEGKRRTVFTASEDWTVIQHNTTTGEALLKIVGHVGWVRALQLLPVKDKTDRHAFLVRSASAPSPRMMASGHSSFAAGGSNMQLWSGAGDGVRVWSEDGGHCLAILNPKTGAVDRIADEHKRRSNKGSKNMAGGMLQASMFQGKAVKGFTVHALCLVGDTIWAGLDTGRIAVFDTVEFSLLGRIKAHTHPVQSLVCVGEDEVWSCAHGARVIKMWSAQDYRPLGRARWEKEAGQVADLLYCAKKNTVWVACRNPGALVRVSIKE